MSTNIEEHASPSSFEGFYPHELKPDPKYAFYNTQAVIDQLIKMKNQKQDLPYNIRYDEMGRPYAEGHLPKLLLHINDEQLNRISHIRNSDYYEPKIPKTNKIDKPLQMIREKYMNIINNIKVEDIQCDCKPKPAFENIFPKSPLDIDAMSYNSCRHTIFAAAKRQIKSAPCPEEKVADEFVSYAKNVIDKEIGEDLTHFGYSFNQWYNHLPKKKQKLMNKVITAINYNNPEILNNKDIDKIGKWQATFDKHTGKKYTTLKAPYSGICKIEIQDLDGKPRMVCSIPDLIKFVMGAVTWHLEDICATKLQGYCGGKNLDQMSDMVNKYISQGFTRVVEGDGSAFDNTQDVKLKEIDRYIYQRVADSVYHTEMASNWKNLFLYFSQSYYKTMNIEYIDHDSKKKKTMMTYSVLGTVFSGDCDTTLANTIRMALYNRFVMDKAGFKYGQDYIAFSKGDDFTVMFNPTLINDSQVETAYWKYFLSKPTGEYKTYDNRIFGIGQICKFLEFGQPNSIKFCSLRAWYTNPQETRIRLTRDPKKFLTLARFSRKMKSMTIPQKIIYLQDLAKALQASYKGIEYFDTMAYMYCLRAKALWQNYDIPNSVIQEERQRLQHASGDKRETLPTQSELDEIEMPKYEIHLRQNVHNIGDDYWESMKKIERVSNRTYAQDALDIMNKQINAEFDPAELSTLLAEK